MKLKGEWPSESMTLEEMHTAHDKFVCDAFDYMEYLGLPDYVFTYEVESVAMTYSKVLFNTFMMGVSYRKAAIIIFALTLDKINREHVKQ